jgi:hypothetical protein
MRMIWHEHIRTEPCSVIGALVAEFNQAGMNSGVIQNRAALKSACRHEVIWNSLKDTIDSPKTLKHTGC